MRWAWWLQVCRRVPRQGRIASKVISSLTLFLPYYLLLFGFFLLSGEVEGISVLIAHLLAASIAVGFTAYGVIHTLSTQRLASRVLTLGLVGGALVGVFALRWPPLRALCYAVWLLGLSRWASPNCHYQRSLCPLARGALLGSLLLMILDLLPNLWYFLNGFSMRLSSFTNGFVKGSSLGASASGLVVLLIFGGFMIGSGFSSRKTRTVAFSLSIGIVFLLHTFTQGCTTIPLLRAAIKASYLAIGVFLVLAHLAGSRTIGSEIPRVRKRPRRAAPVLVAIGAILTAWLLAGLPPLWLNGTPNTETGILFLDHKMLASWQTPADLNPGAAFSGAVFGSLPQYLTAYGYQTEISDVLTEESLLDKNLVIVINPGKYFSQEERQLLRAFVQEGNGLLALGDHTDMGGIMVHLNDLLAPIGVGLRYDSAVSIGEGWRGKLAVGYPFTLLYEASQVPVSIGASLWMKPNLLAYPILVGRKAFSDPGNPENSSHAYLGNLSYDRGETYGDILLAAARHWGKGKAIVFGDTSVFQNTALASSHQYIVSLIEWMVQGPPAWVLILRSLVGLASLVIAGYLIARRLDAGAVTLLGVSLTLAFFLSGLLTGTSSAAPPLTGGCVAYVDASHGNMFDERPLNSNGIDGLLVNLSRNSYLPVIARNSFPVPRPDEPSVFVSVAPTRSFTAKETASLLAFTESGGTTLISTSWPYAKAVSSFLRPLGLDLANAPLGTVDAQTFEETIPVQFVSAWPLSYSSDWTPIALVELEGETFTVAAKRRIGKGELIVFGDASLLLTGNLEGRGFYNEATIAFLNALLDYGE